MAGRKQWQIRIAGLGWSYTHFSSSASCRMRRSPVLLLALLLSEPAFAQLVLPGAAVPAPVGSVVAPPKATRKPHEPRRVAPPAVLTVTDLAGKTLFLNGGHSQMSFAVRDKTVDLSRMLLAGAKISNSRDECQVDVSGMPLTLTADGAAKGLLRFTLPVPACPLTFDVLNGAVLVPKEQATCSFVEADCVVSAGGLWGPPPGDIGPDQVKSIERARTQAEAGVRSAYKGLVLSTKDRALVKGFASEQAGFSSQREETCRDYIGEARHGFCASRLTQARAAALGTAYAAASAEKAAKNQGRRGQP